MLGGKVAEIPAVPRTGPVPRGPATKPMEVTEVSRSMWNCSIICICWLAGEGILTSVSKNYCVPHYKQFLNKGVGGAALPRRAQVRLMRFNRHYEV